MILEKLKSGTSSIHNELEHNNLGVFIMDGSITLMQYETFLRQNFMVYKAVEDFINARYDKLPVALKPFAGYDKTNALAKDISGFSNALLPQPSGMTGAREESTLVGMLYVIEGSMVGGMMMSKKLERCNELSNITEHHFFSKNVTDSLSRWKRFKDAMNTTSFTKAEIQKAVQSARDTFDLFKEVYRQEII